MRTVDLIQCALHGGMFGRAVAGPQADNAPAVAVVAQPDEVLATHRQPALHRAVLRDVSDAFAACAYRLLRHRDIARGQCELAEQHLEQRGLTGPVGSEHGDELAGAHGQVEVVPQHAVAESQPGAGQFGNDVSSHRHTTYRFACGALSSWLAKWSTAWRCQVR